MERKYKIGDQFIEKKELWNAEFCTTFITDEISYTIDAINSNGAYELINYNGNIKYIISAEGLEFQFIPNNPIAIYEWIATTCRDEAAHAERKLRKLRGE